MSLLLFQMATIASALVWAFIMLAPGAGLTAYQVACKNLMGIRIKPACSLVYLA